MKAGKKIARKAEKRSIHHNNAIEARKRKGITEHAESFKTPGSRKK